MAQIFPRWTNRLPFHLVTGVGALSVLTVAGVWYFFSPRFTDVGYQPVQPVAFSHRLHAGELEIDCRYCHASVEVSPVASLPEISTCMNCHRLVKKDSERLAAIRESDETGEPIHWIRVHDLPGYTYFDHSVHLRAGVGCVSCHGDVTAMEEIRQMEPLSMGWCLDCHRDPGPHLRPPGALTDASWRPGPDSAVLSGRSGLRASVDCSACHR